MALMKQPANAASDQAMMPEQDERQKPADIEAGIDDAESEDLTPEEEKQLTQAMDVAMLIIHSEGDQGDKIAGLVLDNQDVAKGIGEAVSAVMITTGKQFEYSDDLKLILAQQIFMEVTALAVEAGALAEDEINDEFIDAAFSHAYTTYLTTKEAMGELDPAELEQSVADATAEGEKLGIMPKGQSPQPEQQQPSQATGLMQRAQQPGGN